MLSKSVGPLTRQTFFSFTGLPDAIGEVQSIQRTRPSWSYSTNVGRIGAMSLAMSMGSLVVVMMMTGMPFFRPSAMKFRRATSFPTNAGPTNRTLELNGIPPYSRSSRRGVPVFTRSAFFSTAMASSASASPAGVVIRAFTAPSRIFISFSFWHVRLIRSRGRFLHLGVLEELRVLLRLVVELMLGLLDRRGLTFDLGGTLPQGRLLVGDFLLPGDVFRLAVVEHPPLTLELLFDPSRVLVALLEAGLHRLEFDLLLPEFLLLREDLLLPFFQFANPGRIGSTVRRLDLLASQPEFRILQLQLLFLLQQRGALRVERLLEFLEPGLAFLDRLDLRLGRTELGGELDRGPLDLLLAFCERSLPRVQRLTHLLVFRLQRRDVRVAEADLLGLRLDLRPGGGDLPVDVPQVLRAFLDRALARGDVRELSLQLFGLVFQLLLQRFQVGLASAKGALFVVKCFPFLLVVLLDQRDLRVVRFQDFPLIHARGGCDQVQEGARDFRRQGADDKREDE